MKPSNVLVRESDGAATVMDFGIAKMTTSTKLTATGQTMGTVRYMSPEQVRGQEVDLRTDLYSLGATLYEALTGDTPFDGSTHFEIMTKHLSERPKPPSELLIDVPETVEAAVLKSLAKKPDDRFADAREMRKVLEAALRQEDVGLVETQKLNRDILGESRPTKKETPPPSSANPARIATATAGGSLADQLEPGESGTVPAKKGRGMLWLLLGGLVVAGGAAATIVIMKGRGASEPVGWTSQITDLAGTTMIAGTNAGGVVVETIGKITPEEIAASYKKTLSAAKAFAAEKKITIDDPKVVQIIAVPADLFCDVRTYTKEVPEDCRTVLGAAKFITDTGGIRLSVIAEPERLGNGMVSAVVSGVCYSAPIDAHCDVMREFKDAQQGGGKAPR